jgi:hypothetical protein
MCGAVYRHFGVFAVGFRRMLRRVVCGGLFGGLGAGSGANDPMFTECVGERVLKSG